MALFWTDVANANLEKMELPEESLIRHNKDKSLLIISKNSQSFSEGDYITLIYEKEKLARGLVAKFRENHAAIKITQIHNASKLEKFTLNEKIQIFKGDESLLENKKPDPEEQAMVSRISKEEDLYSLSLLDSPEEDSSKSKKRHVVSDNLLAVGYGFFPGINSSYARQYYGHLQAFFAHQMSDNLWINGGYGRGLVRDFPVESIDTEVHNFTLKIHYTFPFPFNIYLLPYGGGQYLTASSPGAGETLANNDPSEELNLVSKMGGFRFATGVLLIRRFVPGWFWTANIGLDSLSMKLALEF